MQNEILTTADIVDRLGFLPFVEQAYEETAIAIDGIIALRPVNRHCEEFKKTGFFCLIKDSSGSYHIERRGVFPKGMETKDKSDRNGTIPSDPGLSKITDKIKLLKLENERELLLLESVKKKENTDLTNMASKFSILTESDVKNLISRTEEKLNTAYNDLERAKKRRDQLIHNGHHYAVTVLVEFAHKFPELESSGKIKTTELLKNLNHIIKTAMSVRNRDTSKIINQLNEGISELFNNPSVQSELGSNYIETLVDIISIEKITTARGDILIADHDLFFVVPQNVPEKELHVLISPITKMKMGNVSFIAERCAHMLNYKIIKEHKKDTHSWMHPFPHILHGTALYEPNPEPIGEIPFPLLTAKDMTGTAYGSPILAVKISENFIDDDDIEESLLVKTSTEEESDDYYLWIHDGKGNIKIEIIDINWAFFYDEYSTNGKLPANQKWWDECPLNDGTYFYAEIPNEKIIPSIERNRMDSGYKHLFKTIELSISRIKDSYKKEDSIFLLELFKKAVYGDTNNKYSADDKLSLWQKLDIAEKNFHDKFNTDSFIEAERAGIHIMHYTNCLSYTKAGLDTCSEGLGSLHDSAYIINNLNYAHEYWSLFANMDEYDEFDRVLS